MTDIHLINKAKKVLKELKISYDKDCQPSISRYSDIPEMMLPMFDEEDKSHFSISFELTLPNGSFSGVFVFFDSTSNKIIKMMRHYFIKCVSFKIILSSTFYSWTLFSNIVKN